MKYVWDLKKNEINIQKHGIDFNDAIEMFLFPMLTCIDNRKNYSEERWVGIGFLKRNNCSHHFYRGRRQK